MRKYLPLLDLLSLFASFTAPAHAAVTTKPKVGSTCTKAGVSASSTANLKLICTKSGKKLVWSQASTPAAAPASSTATPTTATATSGTMASPAAPAPAPAKVAFVAKIPIALPISQTGSITFANAADNVSQIPQTAWQKVQDAIAAGSDSSIPINIYIGPTTKTTEQPIIAAIKRELKLFSGFSLPPTYSGVVFGPSDEKWAETKAIDVLRTLGYVSNSFHDQSVLNNLRGACNIENGVATECYGGNAVTVFTKQDGTPITDGFTIYGVQAANGYDAWTPEHQFDGPMTQVNHELTHNVQFAQFIGVPFKSSQVDRSQQAHQASPCWFSEGQANAIGIPVFQTTLDSYLRVRDGSTTRAINPGTTVSLKDFTAAGLTSFLANQDPNTCYNPSTNQDYQLGYSVGYAATEALVAIGGPQATMALLAKGAEGLSWDQAFQAVYGIPWSQGADVLGKVLAAEYAAKPLQR